MLDIYSPLRVADVPFVITNVETAELIKYASNGFLATKISFINETAKPLRGAGRRRRRRWLVEWASITVSAPSSCIPVRAFGGSCFPKDSRADGPDRPREGPERFQIMEAVLEVNESDEAPNDRTRSRDAFGDVWKARRSPSWGCPSSLETDDMQGVPGHRDRRGASSKLTGLGYPAPSIPAAMNESSREGWPDVHYAEDSYEAARGRRRRGDRDRVEPVQGPRAAIRLQVELLSATADRRPEKHLRADAKMAAAGFEYVSVGRAGTASASDRGGAAMTTSVVTGGAGFLGSHLCERLLGESSSGPFASTTC